MQLEGAPIGSLIAGEQVEILVKTSEEAVILSIKDSLKFYTRYIDDIFMIVDDKEFAAILPPISITTCLD